MKRIIIGSLTAIIAAFVLFGCNGGNYSFTEPTANFDLIDSLIEDGDFVSAETLIEKTLQAKGLSEEERYKLYFEKDKMERILREFNLTKEDAVEYISKYIPEVTDSQIDSWIGSGALEAKKIYGKWHFFKKSLHNLFLIDTNAAKAYIAKEGVEEETSDFLKGYLPDVLAESQRQFGLPYIKPQRMRVNVRMRVFPQAAPAGEIVRMWRPYIHESPKYKDIRLLNVYRSDNSTDYIISPKENIRQSLYVEMKANGIDTLIAGYTLEFTSYNEYHPNLEEYIKPYDTSSVLYKTYTSEREQHVIFTKKIQNLTAQIVGNETNPYNKVKKIWSYIANTFPWAGARDYSTIPNIPMYVLRDGHGDCGQVTLLFITMARIAGVPAKWQSGWMLHPGFVNLHDWAQVYYEGVGWVSVDQSFGFNGSPENEQQYYFFSRGLDAYRYIVNEDYGAWAPLYPAKVYPHFDEVDFQMGEVESRFGNIYNGSDGWRCWMDVEYLD